MSLKGSLQVGKLKGLEGFSLEADTRGIATIEMEFPGPARVSAEGDESGFGGFVLLDADWLLPNAIPADGELGIIFRGKQNSYTLYAEASIATYRDLLPQLNPDDGDLAYLFSGH